MTHGSLFSGIGGFDLAAQWMGWRNVFHVERDPFCRQVLTHHFPQSQSFDDVKTFDATSFRGRVSIISGGFPCQPFSSAGKRAGTSDDRYLWPEMFRIIREARPAYVVAENVRGLLSWNDGLVLDTVCADLEGEGYEVFPVVLPAASVNAPHRRDRIWIVAHANDKRGASGLGQVQSANGEVSQRDDDAQPRDAGSADAPNPDHAGSRDAVRTDRDRAQEVRQRFAQPQRRTHGNYGDAPNADGAGREKQHPSTFTTEPGRSNRRDIAGNAPDSDDELREQWNSTGETTGSTEPQNGIESFSSARDGKRNATHSFSGGWSQDDQQHASKDNQPSCPGWKRFPTVAPICSRDDGLSLGLDGITFSKWRRESIKAYGNAIVPQVALQIFQTIQQIEK